MGIRTIHSMHPVWKLAACIILILSISSLHRPEALFPALGVSLFLLLTAPSSLKKKFRSLRSPAILLLFMMPFLLLTPGTQKLFIIGPVSISEYGLTLITEIAMKSISICMVLVFLFDSTETHRLMKALRVLKVPQKIVMLLQYTYRYITIYIEDLYTLRNAARLRGLSVQNTITHSRTSANILFSLMIRSYEQSERVRDAMRLRGFTGSLPAQKTGRITLSDFISGTLIIACSAGLLLMEYLCL